MKIEDMCSPQVLKNKCLQSTARESQSDRVYSVDVKCMVLRNDDKLADDT